MAFFFVAGLSEGVSPHSGDFQARGSGNGFLEQTLATTPGQSYTVDFWAASSGEVFFQVLWGGSSVFSHSFTGSTRYTEFTFNVTASSASTALGFFNIPLGSSLYLDDISVTPAGVPDGGSTVSLLGCALLGLAAVRRKLGC